jgi:hypothetical protein
MRFLDRSESERDHLAAERKAERRRQWRQLQWVAVMLAVLLAVVATFAYVARRKTIEHAENQGRGEPGLARLSTSRWWWPSASRHSSGSMCRRSSGSGASCSRRLRVLEFASRRQPTPISVLKWRSLISVWEHQPALTVRGLGAEDYRRAIGRSKHWPASSGHADYRQALANAYNWLGERSGEAAIGAPAKAAYECAAAS